MEDKELTRNAEGYKDPTAATAIRRMKPATYEEAQFIKLCKIIYNICDMAGFRVEGRITLKNKRSGKVWR